MQVQDDEVALIPELYSSLFTNPVAPQHGKPPKRSRRRKSKGEGSGAALKKRKLSEVQQKMLEISFGCEHKLESERKERLAAELGLDPSQVAVWFQNRRTRWKNKKLEEEYSKLRNDHENLVVEKCRLETEVLSLKDQLTDANEEIHKLQEKQTSNTYYADNVSNNSPISSMTIDPQAKVMDPQLIGEQLGITACFDCMFYVPNGDSESSMDWVNLYYM